MNLNDTFRLFANCIPVKGFSECVICDLQNNDFIIVTMELFEILTLHKHKSLEELSRIYNYKDMIEYFAFLKDNNLGFYTSNPDFFPDIDLSFNECFLLSNAVVEYINQEKYDIYKLFKELDYLNCKNIELKFYDKNISTLVSLLDFISNQELIISSIGIVIEYGELDCELLLNLANKENRISYLIIFNSPKNELIPSKRSNGMGYIIYTKNKITNSSCGIISTDYFITNIKAFTESLHHNSCLHKKISIDQEGNIKNCPSMPVSFGNIKDTTLESTLKQPGFKKYWNLTKDHIEVCKDCEFRYICTDCRAFTEQTHRNAEGLDNSKPLKCGYNPYTGEWEDWSINPLKKKAIEYYERNNLQII